MGPEHGKQTWSLMGHVRMAARSSEVQREVALPCRPRVPHRIGVGWGEPVETCALSPVLLSSWPCWLRPPSFAFVVHPAWDLGCGPVACCSTSRWRFLRGRRDVETWASLQSPGWPRMLALSFAA